MIFRPTGIERMPTRTPFCIVQLCDPRMICIERLGFVWKQDIPLIYRIFIYLYWYVVFLLICLVCHGSKSRNRKPWNDVGGYGPGWKNHWDPSWWPSVDVPVEDPQRLRPEGTSGWCAMLRWCLGRWDSAPDISHWIGGTMPFPAAAHETHETCTLW